MTPTSSCSSGQWVLIAPARVRNMTRCWSARPTRSSSSPLRGFATGGGPRRVGGWGRVLIAPARVATGRLHRDPRGQAGSSSPLRGFATGESQQERDQGQDLVLIAPARVRNRLRESIAVTARAPVLIAPARVRNEGRAARDRPGAVVLIAPARVRNIDTRTRTGRLTSPHRPCEGSQREDSTELGVALLESSSPLRGFATRGLCGALRAVQTVRIAPARVRNVMADASATSSSMRPHRPCEGSQRASCGAAGAVTWSSSPLRGFATRWSRPRRRWSPRPHRPCEGSQHEARYPVVRVKLVLIAPARVRNARAAGRPVR